MTPAARKLERERRHSLRLCAQCAVQMREKDLGHYCDDCTESRAEASARYHAKNPKRRSGRVIKEVANAKRRAVYATKKLTGKCLHAGCPRDGLRDEDYCARHLESSRDASRRYQRRQHWRSNLARELRKAAEFTIAVACWRYSQAILDEQASAYPQERAA